MDGWMDGLLMDKIIITSETENFSVVNFPKQYMLVLLVKSMYVTCIYSIFTRVYMCVYIYVHIHT
jgi:hypothetical protein